MERCSISPVARLTALRCLVSILLVALVTQPSTCNRDNSEGEEQADALSVQLSVTAQVTPTPLWAVVWGPTQPLEDETYHFLSSQETDPLHQHGNQQEASSTKSNWPASMQPREEAPLESKDLEGVEDGGTAAEETEPEEGGIGRCHNARYKTSPDLCCSWRTASRTFNIMFQLALLVSSSVLDTIIHGHGLRLVIARVCVCVTVDPQFYVTVTISSLLILTAVIITAKLCYDRSCFQHPPPLSRGVAPPLSLALPRSLASEDSRQTLHSTSSSFTDRERIPVVNL
ncbi:PILR alpha-associated neural protein isoform X1 [Anarrhichthys ocellatus]|uniref:PILR alpha-associated neural protein isoform X1 n=1 Tax=Anarrhichthys ocellatus TaxID=433405 RepID=UPI0012EE2697|nr:uncharacterized protein LOC116386513 isoform X1 [Anarrhichthys ocellatus]